LDNLQKRYDKLKLERDAAVSAVEEAQSTVDSAVSAEADLRVQNERLVEELRKVREDLELYENPEVVNKKQRLSPSPSPESEGEDLTCVLEARIDDLKQEVDKANEAIELLKVRIDWTVSSVIFLR
jgi:chromosome segregation ATPase